MWCYLVLCSVPLEGRYCQGLWYVVLSSCIAQCPIGDEGLHCGNCRTPLGVGRVMNQLTLTVRVFTKKYYAVRYYV